MTRRTRWPWKKPSGTSRARAAMIGIAVVLAACGARPQRACAGEAAAPAASPAANAEAYPGIPAEPSPGGCGCAGGLVPICRRVPVTRKKPHTEYSMKCEKVCVPGCGCLAGRGKSPPRLFPGMTRPVFSGCSAPGTSSATCDSDTGCGQAVCGDVRIRSRKLLLKKVTQQEVESYEYKIEWVCPSCAFGGGCCGMDPGDGGPAGRGMVWLRRLFGHL